MAVELLRCPDEQCHSARYAARWHARVWWLCCPAVEPWQWSGPASRGAASRCAASSCDQSHRRRGQRDDVLHVVSPHACCALSILAVLSLSPLIFLTALHSGPNYEFVGAIDCDLISVILNRKWRISPLFSCIFIRNDEINLTRQLLLRRAKPQPYPC